MNECFFPPVTLEIFELDGFYQVERALCLMETSVLSHLKRRWHNPFRHWTVYTIKFYIFMSFSLTGGYNLWGWSTAILFQSENTLIEEFIFSTSVFFIDILNSSITAKQGSIKLYFILFSCFYKFSTLLSILTYCTSFWTSQNFKFNVCQRAHLLSFLKLKLYQFWQGKAFHIVPLISENFLVPWHNVFQDHLYTFLPQIRQQPVLLTAVFSRTEILQLSDFFMDCFGRELEKLYI